MLHRMKINSSAFERMKNGTKKREYRVNDEKRKLVRAGDVIEFENLANKEEKILMDVKNIETYKTLEEAISAHFDEDFGNRHKDIKSTIDSFHKYYTEEEIKENEMIVFEIKNIV